MEVFLKRCHIPFHCKFHHPWNVATILVTHFGYSGNAKWIPDIVENFIHVVNEPVL